MKKILSFDVGIKNLAYCLMCSDNKSILDWGILNISIDPVCDHKAKGKCCDKSASKCDKDGFKLCTSHSKLKMYKDKLQNFSATTRKIKGEAEREVRQFEESKVKESGNMVKRLERDAASKIMYEKKLMINNLNHEFLDAVIGQVKTTIGADKKAQEKATKNLLSEI